MQEEQVLENHCIILCPWLMILYCILENSVRGQVLHITEVLKNVTYKWKTKALKNITKVLKNVYLQMEKQTEMSNP